MKKVVFVIIAVTLSVTTIAQLGVGPKAGLNRYALTGDDQSYLNALHVGGFVQVPVSGLFAVQPELLFSKQGNAFEENGEKFGTYTTYLNIPVMLQLNTKSGFFAEAGPEFGFLLAAKYKETGSTDEDVKKFFKGSNFSLGAGVGYRLKMGLGFGVRYNFGLANISAEDNFETKTTGGQVSVSYKFAAGKKSKKEDK
jgi:Outer membrane protein beta-barrel domain